MRFITFFVLFAIGYFAILSNAYSHDHHYVPRETIINVDSRGAALATATAQLNFDWSTVKSQGGIGVGNFDNQSAVSFGAAKRVGDVLVNGSIGFEGNKVGYGAGINWRF